MQIAEPTEKHPSHTWKNSWILSAKIEICFLNARTGLELHLRLDATATNRWPERTAEVTRPADDWYYGSGRDSNFDAIESGGVGRQICLAQLEQTRVATDVNLAGH
jgi:hypothetical protein